MNLQELIPASQKKIFIYGEPASGKTTFTLQYAINYLKQGNKVIFIDTERSLSIERFNQLTNNNYKLLDNLLVYYADNFHLQRQFVKNLANITKSDNIKLIIIDTVGNHYRRFYSKNKEMAVTLMKHQLKLLNKLSKNIQIILTNQTYKDLNGNVKSVGGFLFNGWAKYMIQLKKDPRKMIFEKPSKEILYFDIKEEGILIKDLTSMNAF